MWGGLAAAERAAALHGAAARLRERRLELAALQVRECAKPWPEADADVCEAIDFLEYYARQAIELERGPELIQVPGERNRMRYVPRGVAAVIAPWNFPLAIPCGMTAAALAAGNAAVLKPAEQSPASAGALVDALHEGGVPPDAVALLPGFGDAGAALVRDPRVHVIAFTGSSAVGLEILRDAASTPEGQPHVKRVVSEMGGKNCVIVDADADLDEAVPGIVHSAFAYAGQKCSAAARVLVHEAVADTLVERLAGAIEVLRVGQAEEFATEVPPVIEREAQERVLRYAELAERDGRIAARAAPVPAEGWFCPPALAVGLPEESPVNREEVFGPLLSVTSVASRRGGLRRRRLAPVRAHRRPVLAQPGDRRAGGGAAAGREPVREPGDHRGDGGPAAVRRKPALGDRGEGGRPRLPVPVHRAACSYGEHNAARNTRRLDGKEEEMIGAIILGLLAGYIAKALMPGKDPGGFLVTIGLGLAGSLIGFFLFTELLGIGDDQAFDLGGLIGAIIGTMILLASTAPWWGAVRGRSGRLRADLFVPLRA